METKDIVSSKRSLHLNVRAEDYGIVLKENGLPKDPCWDSSSIGIDWYPCGDGSGRFQYIVTPFYGKDSQNALMLNGMPPSVKVFQHIRDLMQKRSSVKLDHAAVAMPFWSRYPDRIKIIRNLWDAGFRNVRMLNRALLQCLEYLSHADFSSERISSDQTELKTIVSVALRGRYICVCCMELDRDGRLLERSLVEDSSDDKRNVYQTASQMKECIDTALKQAKTSSVRLTEILLSAEAENQVLSVYKKKLAQYYPNVAVIDLGFKAAARGAALVAGKLAKQADGEEQALISAIPHTLWIENEGLAHIGCIIEKGSPLPASGRYLFRLNKEYNMKFRIFEGEELEMGLNDAIGTYRIRIPEGDRVQTSEVELLLMVDANGLVKHLTAIEKNSGKYLQIDRLW